MNSEEIVSLWRLAKQGKVLPRVLMAEWRCTHPSRCLLAQVFWAEERRFLVLTNYTLSRQLNDETSVSAARAKNTRDGENHWRARGVELEQAIGFGDQLTNVGYAVNCRHVLQHVLTTEDLSSALQHVRPGVPVRLTVP